MKKFLMIPVALLASTAFAAPKISAQSIIVNPTQPDLSVSVRVDKDTTGSANPVYLDGEPIRISTSVNRDAYVYLFNLDSTGEVTQILPNRLSNSGGNFVKANTTVTFPSQGDNFVFNVGGPVGLNKVLALASLEPLNLDQITSFKTTQDQFATAATRGQDQLAQALSIVVNPIPQNSWVSDTAFFSVASRAPVTTGSLFVGTNVPGSTVIINGRTLGAANTTYSGIAPGSYPVRVKAPGFADYTTTITVRANTTTNLNVEFNRTNTPVPTPAPVVNTNNYSFVLRSSVSGARVFVDGVEAGTIQNGSLALNVTRGGHEVVIIAPGYRTFINTYNVTQNAQVNITPVR
ncbi:PEGA domain-containing protein [Deinococcus radiodurans]|jgi:PEGA domain.|uniref:S-layer-like array-related protein n=1 Tax=Deinococcus radiodurans (strain ATCC 13939 / DSM 20539 / JCM 16871 / CCUG 27074 / LMG 4051 / NBRC 15346 / NCIMB 9279 / VKM B-1422 / R1) TaxID=243230 RepID=Q9RV45_DEIRA|nr:PEGA domain-containing protein [Deinococcus radiodurans]AAF10753.1 S-layer-like array-related protein [Deinococcus radiodurans R1 = ATCC 13939 = DSM 20539]ANC71643.1 S-layer protein [Deinococcus radiodurans R1 = ATCC 13939 = DSM 20539]QEM70666.1 PEGA domain-containing protein [Deinococcus radiodurans]QIP29266.1 PEGA domain-containing protein [Deinococcus radiodurans]QIP32043.1 PEGA domain-containing protein [Deinococcus radiodurans]